MNREAGSWLIAAVRLPLIILRFVFGPVFSLLFGWVDMRLASKHEKQLVQDVKDALPFLFAEQKGRLVPNEAIPCPPAFDYAFVTVALDGLLLRFSRGRGELAVSAAPVFAPSDWHELPLVLSAITGQGEIERAQYRDLWDVSRALQPHIKALTEFFSLKQFDTLKRRLDDEVYSRDRVAIREWQAEINRKLYGR